VFRWLAIGQIFFIPPTGAKRWQNASTTFTMGIGICKIDSTPNASLTVSRHAPETTLTSLPERSSNGQTCSSWPRVITAGSPPVGIVKLTSHLYSRCSVWHTRRCDTTTTDEPGQGQTHGMTPPAPTTQLYKRHCFPAEIISHLSFFEFVHNVRKRGNALLGALIELLVT
jgi:hypothetical protein